MLNELVGQLLKSGTGEELLKSVQAHGLSADQATRAVTATAEGAMSQLGSGSGVASAVGDLLGGGGAGGLASMAAGLLGGSPGAAATGPASSFASFAPAIAQFVSQKTGLAPALATTVVSLALPKLETLIRSQLAGSGASSPDQGGASSLLGGLLR